MDQQFKNVTGRFGLGARNMRGEGMPHCCQEHNLMVTNTLFHHHVRQLHIYLEVT